MDPKVAVVVVSYNTKELLFECIESVFKSTKSQEIELVIVDNASEDRSYEAVSKAYPGVTMIRNATNLGFGAASNQGIKATKAKFILLLNSDARLTDQAYESLCDCLEQDPQRGAAGCRLVDTAGVEVINTRNFLTPLNQALELAGVRIGNGRLMRTRRPHLDRNSVDCSVDWIDAACLMLRRKALPEDGPFDERFFMYSEDEDLCFRLRKRGWLVCFCGAATAVHKGAGSSRLNKNEMLRHFYMSQMLFLSKHRSKRSRFVYTALMKTVLFLKRRFLRDDHRRRTAAQQLIAFREALAWRDAS
jgi:N-acetylglucosaminyl-diphospho-decaprenol L-rhamnosyltransferase